jgi:HEAT repeat protein
MIRHSPLFFAALVASLCVIHPSAAAPPEVEVLVKQLKDKDETVRLKAAKELGRMKAKAAEALPALTKALQDEDEDVRAVAKRAIAAIKEAVGEGDIEAIRAKLQPYIRDLKSKESKVRISALEQLAEMGTDAKEAGAAIVEYGMMCSSAKVREAAYAAYEKIDPVVHKEVLTLLIDENHMVQLRAAGALAQMGPKGKPAVPALKAFLVQETSKRGRDSSVILSYLAALAPDDAQVQGIVLGWVGSSPIALAQAREARRTFIQMMHSLKIDNKSKYNALMTGLGTATTSFDRVLCISEIGKLGSDAKAALPLLQRLKVDPDAEVRKAANLAIDQVKE